MSDSLPKLRASTACPACHQRHVLDIEAVMAARPIGEFSLAGAQMKVSANLRWRFRCLSCGLTGAAEGSAGLTPESVMELDVQPCGHVAAMEHFSETGHGEHADTCAGCCLACQEHGDQVRATRKARWKS